ncbi:MAG: molybdate ABC transporter substrate-binding protein [Acidobacteriota bacterium]
MKRLLRLAAGILVILQAIAAGLAYRSPEAPPLQVFAGSATKPALEEAATAFRDETGIPVDLVLGGSGYVLSQLKLSRRGDVYFPGSSDFMEQAKRDGVVDPESERIVAYLVPAINVPLGNPKGIRSLRDLLRPGLRIAIANPEAVCVGLYAVEIVESAFSSEELEQFRANLVNYTGSCAQTAAVVALRQADAVLGWRVFSFWEPERIETVPLRAPEIRRIGYLPAAVARFSRQPKSAARFIDFLTSERGRAIFRRHHYFVSPEEAFTWIGETKPVGGEYRLAEPWRAR